VKIGIVAENRPAEKRVVIQPSEICDIAHSHEVVVEKGAGLGIGIRDEAYIEAGCKIVSREEAYAGELVLRIKEPNFEEVRLMRPGSIVMSMMHIRCQPKLEEVLRNQKLIVIPLENLKDIFGRRKVEVIEDAGRCGMEYAFKLWGKDPSAAMVKFMGYGNMAMGAIRCAARKGAKIQILNKNNFLEMGHHLPNTDILVDAINRPYRREVEKEPFFVTREMLRLLRPGSVILDLVSTPVNHAPVETMRPTHLDNLHYVVDGIYHASCWGWPGLDPEKVTKRYSLQIKPILKDLADNGIDKCDDLTKAAVIDLR